MCESCTRKDIEYHSLMTMKKVAEAYKDDTEMAHREADKILCILLKALGQDEIVEIFRSLDR